MRRSIVVQDVASEHAGTDLHACAGCQVTCVLLYSVGCVKAHKVANDCDGRRCKTAYVSQSEFTDTHLLSG